MYFQQTSHDYSVHCYTILFVTSFSTYKWLFLLHWVKVWSTLLSVCPFFLLHCGGYVYPWLILRLLLLLLASFSAVSSCWGSACGIYVIKIRTKAIHRWRGLLLLMLTKQPLNVIFFSHRSKLLTVCWCRQRDPNTPEMLSHSLQSFYTCIN